MPLEVTGLNRNYVKIVYWTRCTVDGFVTCTFLILSIDHIVFCPEQDAVCFDQGCTTKTYRYLVFKYIYIALPGSRLVNQPMVNN